MYANHYSTPPPIFDPYLSISVIPHSPDKDQQVPKERHCTQDPDGDAEEIVRHQVLARGELIRFRETLLDVPG